MLKRLKFSDKEKKELIGSMVILVDTKEKKNQHIVDYLERNNIKCKSMSLKQGDYSFYIPKNEKLGIPRDLYFDKEIIIERKASLEELSTNLTKERDRFEKELALAPENKCIIIENGSYDDLIHGNYDTQYQPKSYLASFQAFWHRYGCPVFMLGNPKNSYVFIKFYFESYLKEQLR